MNLAGAKIVARWKDVKTGNVYSLAELDLRHVKETVQGTQDMNADLRRYIQRNAENIFDKVATQGGGR